MGSNAKSGSAAKITLEKFDDLFGGSAAQESGVEQIINAPLAELYTFKDHPFRVEDDEKMEETTESIRQYGVLVPGIARPRAGGGYEIIAGHRRKRGSELAGKTEMPVIVRNYTDDEATIIMVDSNIQREDILPSEKAKAYKMKYEAMKHQGKKSGRNTLDEVGEAAGENAKKVQRYIWLSRLSDELLAIEVTDNNIKSFERVAKKYNVQFAVKKDKTEKPPKHIVLFKGKDADVITQAFKEFVKVNEKKHNRISVKEKLEEFREQLGKNKNRERAREHLKDRGQSL